jgi:BolA protein
MPHTSTALPLSLAELNALLAQAFAGAQIDARDDTHLHAGHNAQMEHSGGHYKVRMVWAGFAHMSRIARQRAVQRALAAAWEAGQIHALTLHLLTPEQAAALR